MFFYLVYVVSLHAFHECLLEIILTKIIVIVVYSSIFVTYHYFHRLILLLSIVYFYDKKDMTGMIFFFLLWLFFINISFYCVHFYIYPMYPWLSSIEGAMKFALYGYFDFESLAILIIAQPPVLKDFAVIVRCFLMENHFFTLILLIGVVKFIRNKNYEALLLVLLFWLFIMNLLYYYF